MKKQGKLIKWNNAKALGVIELNNHKQVLVHLSAFPQNGSHPKIGEFFCFDVIKNKKGKFQAVHVERLSSEEEAPHFELVPDEVLDTPLKPARRPRVWSPLMKGFFRDVRHFFSRLFRLVIWLLLIGGAVFAYHHFDLGTEIKRAWASFGNSDAVHDAYRMRCDGRTFCSQMRSCEEAKWVLNNCPNTEMDGDGDGIPCEKQWCR